MSVEYEIATSANSGVPVGVGQCVRVVGGAAPTGCAGEVLNVEVDTALVDDAVGCDVGPWPNSGLGRVDSGAIGADVRIREVDEVV